MSGTIYDLSVCFIKFSQKRTDLAVPTPCPQEWVYGVESLTVQSMGGKVYLGTISALESNGVVACTGHTHRLKETFIIKICHLCKMRFITALSLVSFTEHGARFYEA